jgi:hypothetical protein
MQDNTQPEPRPNPAPDPGEYTGIDDWLASEEASPSRPVSPHNEDGTSDDFRL